MFLAFAAAFLLPRQFHMIFTENLDDRGLRTASWAFPLFLLALAAAIPPILWAGEALAAVAFLMAGLGMHMTQTAGLALAADRATEETRPRVVALLYVMYLIGMGGSAIVVGWLLRDFAPFTLVRVVQGVALAGILLNLVALWKQEKIRPMSREERAAPRPRFRDAWAGYLAWADRLPAPPEPVETRPVGGVEELLGETDLVVLDAYGVLHLGGPALAPALQALRMLDERRIPFCVVTNDVTRAPAEVARGLSRRGLPVAPDAVISGHDLLAEALAPHDDGVGVALLSSAPEPLLARFPGTLPAPADRAGLDAARGFVFLDSEGWDEDRYARVRDSLKGRPRPLIVCNPDVACPQPDGAFSAEPGWFAHRLADETGVVPQFLGKPFPGIYDLVKARFSDVPPGRMLMVGDSPHTDVLGGRRAGMRVMLVRSGFLRQEDTAARLAECGLSPHFLAPHL